MSSEDR
jgi:hypothetical protein